MLSSLEVLPKSLASWPTTFPPAAQETAFSRALANTRCLLARKHSSCCGVGYIILVIWVGSDDLLVIFSHKIFCVKSFFLFFWAFGLLIICQLTLWPGPPILTFTVVYFIKQFQCSHLHFYYLWLLFCDLLRKLLSTPKIMKTITSSSHITTTICPEGAGCEIGIRPLFWL